MATPFRMNDWLGGAGAAPKAPSGMASAWQTPPRQAQPAPSPYFDPRNSYGGDRNWYDTSAVKGVDLPRADFERYLATQGLGGDSARDRYAQGQYGRTQAGYQAAWQNNPELAYRDYLKQYLGGGIADGYNRLSASQRGVNPTSRVSTIRWG
ncbi:hypothetical protein [Iamia sp.]|uniref:hypothetical protein n=1 Tax=Iamia sp. TaxID=2722710 RepID=UPI002BC65768|nr:hypothetical protein [Iamia sp.]HXH56610.1 hypothetical protein [Iamia sp.]